MTKGVGRRAETIGEAVKRFWSKVRIGDSDQCWPWRGGKFSNGYGAFSYRGKLVRAHRFAYEATKGAIDAGRLARHKCDNRPCCNPNHIIPGTHGENMADRNSRGRQARGEGVNTSKLTPELVRAIRNDPRGARPVARDHGVARSMVQRIRQHRAWTHV